MAFRTEVIQQALQHLCDRDVVMREIIEQVGGFTLRPERDRFQMLVRSIISQQISLGAARTIRQRLEQLAGPGGITPERLLQCEFDQLRSVGLSRQKTTYLLDLAQKVDDGTVRLKQIARLNDQAIIDQLTQVKGIGVWTAQMFLIFALGRLDVFPHDDLGVRAAIRNHYGLEDLPTKARSLEIAAAWRPYASVASWYCWRSLELPRRADAAPKTQGYPT